MAKLDLDLSLAKGSFQLAIKQQLELAGVSVIWGESGSGKSLLLRSIAGYEKTAKGQISLGPNTLQNSAQKHFTAAYQRDIGYVSQQPNLFAHLSVLQNLEFAYKRNQHKAEQGSYSFKDIIAAFKLTDLLYKYPEMLSGGEKQRCAIAQALLAYPKLLLMDEPLAALDNANKVPILKFLAAIPAQFSVPILYVTHSYEELLKLADRVLLIKAGKVVGYYPLAEFCSNHANRLVPADQLASLLTGTIAATNEEGLDRIACEDQQLYIPSQGRVISSQLRTLILAKDVSISLTKATDSSILNLLAVTINEIHNYSETGKLLTLQLGQQQLLSLITNKSFKELGLQKQQQVFAQIKTISFIR